MRAHLLFTVLLGMVLLGALAHAVPAGPRVAGAMMEQNLVREMNMHRYRLRLECNCRVEDHTLYVDGNVIELPFDLNTLPVMVRQHFGAEVRQVVLREVNTPAGPRVVARVQMRVRRKILGIIPWESDVDVDVDVETGEVMGLPWWFSLILAISAPA